MARRYGPPLWPAVMARRYGPPLWPALSPGACTECSEAKQACGDERKSCGLRHHRGCLEHMARRVVRRIGWSELARVRPALRLNVLVSNPEHAHGVDLARVPDRTLGEGERKDRIRSARGRGEKDSIAALDVHSGQYDRVVGYVALVSTETGTERSTGSTAGRYAIDMPPSAARVSSERKRTIPYETDRPEGRPRVARVSGSASEMREPDGERGPRSCRAVHDGVCGHGN
jgi:hypothetical protein